MGEAESVKVGRRGSVLLPTGLRRQFDIGEGSVLIAEATANGILLRPALVLPVESYSPERRAEFLLNNALDDDDYEWARREVRELGIDPDHVPHERPGH
jgi:AbrB family looped-hinge helix DNA binding protein